jgi:rRNA-processing protein FCF1
VIVDTNFVSRKYFNKAKLDALGRRLAQREHDFIVPAVVVWEWAVHAHEALSEARLLVGDAIDHVDGALGVELVPVPEVTAGDLASRMFEIIDELDDVFIAPTEPEDAVDALGQQVMQTGMGSTRDGVRTGAVDALIVHAVRRALDEYEEVVLASNDRALGAAVKELDDEVVVVTDQYRLWQWHGLTPPPDDQLAESIARFAAGEIEESLAVGGDGKLFDQGEEIDANIYEFVGFTTEDVRQVDLTLEGFSSATFSEVEVVEGDEEPRLVTGKLEVIGQVSVVNWFVGGPDGELLSEWARLSVSIVVRVTVELDAEWSPISYEPDDYAEVWLGEDEY